MSKILIIGGGVAGLSAGIYARMSGHEAIVCESHFVPGGNLTGWNRGGYHIDNCIHWLTGTNPSSPMYRMWLDLGMLGEEVKIVQPASLFTCDKDGGRISLKPSLSELYKDMLAVSPEDKKEIVRFCSAIELVMATENIAGPDCNEGMTLGRLISGIGPTLKYFGLTTSQLAKRFKSPLLRNFITGFWGDDFGALALLYVYATYCGKNGALPEGGSLKAAERITEKYLSLGGKLLLKKKAAKVNIKDGKAYSVSFSDGDEIEADYIILTTDPAATFGNTVDLAMPKAMKKLYDNKKLRRFSAYHASFSVDSAELPFEGDLIFDVPKEYVDELGTKQLIVREFSHEPSYAPEGKNIIQTMTFTFGDERCMEFIRLKNEDMVGYKLKKERLAEILRALIEDRCPTLRGRLELIDFWTPASYVRFVGSEVGSFMSFAIPGGFLPVPRDGSVDGADNLFMATQWQQAPGGLPTAAERGRAAIEKINKLNK